MAQSTVQINIDVNSKSINDLEKELAQVNEELADVKVGSDAFKELAGKAQKLEGALADVNKQVEGFTAEKKFMGADGAIKAFAGSVSGVVGVFGLLGVESEKLGKFEEKAASAIALSMGLKDMAEGYKQIADSEVLAAIKAKIFGTTAKAAIAATGIGLFVVALATVVEYWDDIKGAIDGASAAQKDLLADQEKGVKAAEEGLAAISAQENILKLQGKSEKEILQLKMNQTDEVISQLTAQLETQKQIKKAQVEAAERNQKIAAGIIGFLTAPITVLLGAVDALTYGLQQVGVLDEATSLAKDFTMGVASLIFDPEEVASEGDAAIEETEKKLTQLKNQRAGYQLQIKAIDQKAADERKAASDKEAEEAKKRAEDEAKALADRAAALREQASVLGLTARELAKKEFEERIIGFEEGSQAYKDAYALYQAELTQIEKDELEERSNLEKTIREANALTEEEQFALKLQKTQEYYDGLIEQAKKFGLDTVELEKSKNEAIEAETQAHQDKEKQKEQAFRQQLVDLAIDSGMSLISTLKDLNSIYDADNEAAAKKAFERQKALSIVETLISTYTTAQKAYQSQFVPVPDPSSPVRGAIAAAVAVASGLAKLAVIKSQKFAAPSSSGGGTAAGGSVPASSAPSTSFATAGAPIVTPNVTPTIKAYVLSGDVRDGQEADAKINNRRKV